jgi:hypothetical protein
MKTLYGLILAWLITAMVCSGCAQVPHSLDADPKITKQSDTSSSVFLRQAAVVDAMGDRYPGVEYDLWFYPCRTQNSFYFPVTGYYPGYGSFDAHDIVLCTEFNAYPRVAVYVAAHEMAHAITHQVLGVLDEESADEVAALELIRLGLLQELLDGSLYWAAAGGDETGDSGHPANNFRAWNLACLASGADGHPAECVALYRGTLARWEARLAKGRVD